MLILALKCGYNHFFGGKKSVIRVKLNPDRWEWVKAHETRYCCPVGERFNTFCRACSDVRNVRPENRPPAGLALALGKETDVQC